MGPEEGPIMIMKVSLCLLISNVLGRDCGLGEGVH